MASDLFPIRRSGQKGAANAVTSGDLLRGNPLADAVVRAFRETFGLPLATTAVAVNDSAEQAADGTIVPPTGEINP